MAKKTSMDSRSASCRMSRSISISQGGLERLRGQLAILLTAFGLGRFQTVAFPHGDVALNQDLIGVVDDTVHDCLGYRTSGVGIGVNTGIPALRLVLSAEDHGSLATCLHNLQQIIGFLEQQGTDQPLIQDQDIHLLVGGEKFLQLTAVPSDVQLMGSPPGWCMPQYYHEGCPNERTAPGNSPQELKARHLSYSDLNTLAAEGYAILMNGRDSHAGHLGIVFPIVNLLQGGFR